MGLLVKKLDMPYGIEFRDVYFKLNRISYNDETQELYFAGAFYVNKDLRNGGAQPLENGILCEVIPLEDKTINMYEYVYNFIKMRCAEIISMTQEEIEAHNSKVYEAAQANEQPISNLINLNYALFIDAQDC